MRTLIIRSGAIGDCICWLPVLPFLQSGWTEVWIPSAIVPLVKEADKVCSLASTGLDGFGLPGRDPDPVLFSRLASFDRILSWYGAKQQPFVEAILAVGATSRFFEALPPLDFERSATDFFAQQIGAQLGLCPRIDIDRAAKRDRIVIHPFSGSLSKNWPLPGFQELATQLPLVAEWLVGPQEMLPNAIKIERLDDLACWLSGARCYIGNDSGITHLAAAVGIRTLAFFGVNSPRCWEPRSPNVQVLRAHNLAMLSVAEVLRTLNQLPGWL